MRVTRGAEYFGHDGASRPNREQGCDTPGRAPTLDKLTMKDLDEEEWATVKALEVYKEHGSDLTKPMTMEFFVLLPSEAAATEIAKTCSSRGFATKVKHTPTVGGFTCYCEKTIIPSYENVRAIELELDSIARPFGGKSDGFGS